MGFQKGLRALVFISVLQGYQTKITFPIDHPAPAPTSGTEAREFVRSLEVTDFTENEVDFVNRKLQDDDRWNDWNFEDKDRRWSPPPNEKTISLQMLDDDPYQHGRPSWPHDEYLLGYFDLNRTPSDLKNFNASADAENVSKYYDWKDLQHLQPKPSQSALIGPGFYDVGSSSDYYGTTALSPEYFRYQPTYQAISDGTGNAQSTQQGQGTESVPSSTSESSTNTRHLPGYIPYDFYKRKRLRLQIHPGLIAAPLAGLAAFGAASALTSKPLLLELGYVRNKPEVIPGGWGLVGTPGHGFRPYPPFYPPPNPPPILPPIGFGTAAIPHHPIVGGINHGHAQAGGGLGGVAPGAPLYPILKPHRGRPDGERSSWWNPFSALTPRLVIE